MSGLLNKNFHQEHQEKANVIIKNNIPINTQNNLLNNSNKNMEMVDLHKEICVNSFNSQNINSTNKIIGIQELSQKGYSADTKKINQDISWVFPNFGGNEDSLFLGVW